MRRTAGYIKWEKSLGGERYRGRGKEVGERKRGRRHKKRGNEERDGLRNKLQLG